MVPEGTLKQWVSGHSRPFSDALVAFAEEMGVTLDYLVRGKEPRTPGLARTERSLAADLRAYLVESLSRRTAAPRPDRPKRARFFEEFLPRDQSLLATVVEVWWQTIEASHRERWERTRSDVLQVLAEKLDRAEQVRDRRAQDKLRKQIVAGVRAASVVPLLLDEPPEVRVDKLHERGGEAESTASQPDNPFGTLVVGPSAPERPRRGRKGTQLSLEHLKETLEANPSTLDALIEQEFKRAQAPRKGALRLLIEAERKNVKHEADADVPARPNVIARLETALASANHG